MINCEDKKSCSGCSACVNICPKHCITLKSDIEGFLYPSIDTKNCVNCNLCEKVCPVIGVENKQEITNAYIVRNRDIDITKGSSSGGFFSALCKHVISKNGVVYGAIFDDNLMVKHIKAESMDQCEKFYGSKYVQSDLNNVFSQIKELLEKDVLVCFSGTPCQTAGLSKYLGKRYNNLILVDLVCHGVPSPKLWQQYLSIMSEKYGSRIASANFRSKKYGYQSSAMHLRFENGKNYYGTARVDIMLKSFFSHIALRKICYSCPFKGRERVSDFTIYDCWHASKILGLKDDDKGYTSVLVRNSRACEIMNELNKYLYIWEKPVDDVIPVNGGMLMKSAKMNPRRENYYSEICNNGLEASFNKFLYVSKKDYLIESLKAFLSNINVLYKISKLNKRIRKMKERNNDTEGTA